MLLLFVPAPDVEVSETPPRLLAVLLLTLIGPSEEKLAAPKIETGLKAVSAMLAAALTETTLGKTMGVLAVALAAVNVFGGFLVTRRMLEMFRKKEKKALPAPAESAKP